jgi:hypothetical protein
MKKDGAERHNQGKPKLSMILEMPHALEGVTRVLEHGAEVYGRRNYQQGLPYTEVADSFMRHVLAWINDEDNDVKSGLPHVDHMACNALFLAEFARTRTEFDDRCGGRVEAGRAEFPPDMAEKTAEMMKDTRDIRPGPGGDWWWAGWEACLLGEGNAIDEHNRYEVSYERIGGYRGAWFARRAATGVQNATVYIQLGEYGFALDAQNACVRDKANGEAKPDGKPAPNVAQNAALKEAGEGLGGVASLARAGKILCTEEVTEFLRSKGLDPDRPVQEGVFPGPGGNWQWTGGVSALKASPRGTWGEYEVTAMTDIAHLGAWRASRCFNNPDGTSDREPLGMFPTAEEAQEACARDEHIRCKDLQEEGWRRNLREEGFDA